MQNLDAKTNKLAEETFGQIWHEREDFQGHDLRLSSAMETRAPSITRRKEKQHRYEASYFPQLPKFHAVMFNKEEKNPRRRIVEDNLEKGAQRFSPKDLAAAANDYYQAYIENRAWQLGIPHLFDARDNLNLADLKEREQRAKGILRSWRGNMPIGLPEPRAEAGERNEEGSELQGNGNDEGQNGTPADITEEAAKQILQELGAPKPEDLFKYVDQNKSWLSDLEASQRSDPFYKPEDDKITVPATTSEAEPPPNEPTSDSDSDFEKMVKGIEPPKGLEQATRGQAASRVFSNLDSVPDGLQNPDADRQTSP
jgi:hypothetical protein